MAISTGSKNAPHQLNKTPAPKITRNTGGLSYGQANDGTPSSTSAPGQNVISDLGANLKSSVDDPALDLVINRGLNTKGDGVSNPLNSQTRDIGSHNVPTHSFMKGASAGGKVPDKI